MTTIRATIKGGRLELDVPADWPDGTEVEIHPIEHATHAGTMSAEEIAKTLAAMDQVEPFDITEEESAVWEAERHTAKQREKAQFSVHAEERRQRLE